MTVVESLRQAEVKFQNVLGLTHDTDVITFVHSPDVDCFMVNSIDDIFRNDESGWKVTIMDRDGQVRLIFIIINSFTLNSQLLESQKTKFTLTA